MVYTYKICLTCDASGYNRETKVRCNDCNGKGIKIRCNDYNEKGIKITKEEEKEEDEINTSETKESQ